MHMEAITFLFYSSTDCSSAGHDYNLQLVEEKTLLLSLFLPGCVFQSSSAAATAEMLLSPRDPGKKNHTNTRKVPNAVLFMPGH